MITVNYKGQYTAAHPSDGYEEKFSSRNIEHLRQNLHDRFGPDAEKAKFFPPSYVAERDYENSGWDVFSNAHLYHLAMLETSLLIPGYLHHSSDMVDDTFAFDSSLYLSTGFDEAMFIGVLSYLSKKFHITSVEFHKGRVQVMVMEGGDVRTALLTGFRPWLYELLDVREKVPVAYESPAAEAFFADIYKTESELSEEIIRTTQIPPEKLAAWLDAYGVDFIQADPGSQVKYLYFYDIKKHPVIKTAGMSGKVSPKAYEMEKSKVTWELGPESDRLIFFASRIPIDHLDWVFRGQHSIWYEGRVVYEHVVTVSDLKGFKFEVVDAPEMMTYKTSPLLGGERSPDAVTKDLKTTIKFRGWSGSTVAALKAAIAPFQNLCFAQFFALMKRNDLDNILEDMAPSITRIHIYPKSAITPSHIVKLAVGGKAPKEPSKMKIFGWI